MSEILPQAIRIRNRGLGSVFQRPTVQVPLFGRQAGAAGRKTGAIYARPRFMGFATGQARFGTFSPGYLSGNRKFRRLGLLHVGNFPFGRKALSGRKRIFPVMRPARGKRPLYRGGPVPPPLGRRKRNHEISPFTSGLDHHPAEHDCAFRPGGADSPCRAWAGPMAEHFPAGEGEGRASTRVHACQRFRVGRPFFMIPKKTGPKGIKFSLPRLRTRQGAQITWARGNHPST